METRLGWQIGSSVKDGKKLVLKACSLSFMLAFLHCLSSQNLQSESGSYQSESTHVFHFSE